MNTVCGPNCSPYICPQSGETECVNHGGFDNCCAHPRCPGNRDRVATEAGE